MTHLGPKAPLIFPHSSFEHFLPADFHTFVTHCHPQNHCLLIATTLAGTQRGYFYPLLLLSSLPRLLLDLLLPAGLRPSSQPTFRPMGLSTKLLQCLPAYLSACPSCPYLQFLLLAALQNYTGTHSLHTWLEATTILSQATTLGQD